MTLEQYAYVAEIMGVILVIASLVYVGIGLRDSSIQAQIATAQEMVAQRTGWRELIATDEDLADLYMRGLKSYRQLTPLEQERFELLMRSFMHKLSVSIAARNVNMIGGTRPDPSNRVIEGELARMLDEPGFREWWETCDRRAMAVDVVNLTDELDALRA